VLADDCVGPRRVHDVEVAEDFGGVAPLQEVRLEELLAGLVAVAHQVDAVGGGGDPLGEDLFAEEGVDERALPGVELAGDDEEEEAGEGFAGLLEVAEVVGVDVGPEAFQRRRQPFEELALACAQLRLALAQNALPPPQQSSQRHAVFSACPVASSDLPRSACSVANAGPHGQWRALSPTPSPHCQRTEVPGRGGALSARACGCRCGPHTGGMNPAAGTAEAR
jgi:hypothetical protein